MKHLPTLVMMGLLFCPPAIHAEGAATPAATAAVQDTDRDEKVIERLVSMGQYLRGLKSFGIHADTTNDEVMENGQKLQFAGAADYLVRSPEGLRMELKSDRRHRIYTYNGKSLTQYSPKLGFYATVDATGPIGKMMIQIKEQYDLEMPLADLFLWGTDKADLKDIKEAGFVGVEQINGHASEHFAFRQEGVDWQIWIQPGEQPLPDKLVVTATDEPEQPSYAATLKWDMNATMQDADFSFTAPKDAVKIEIVRVDVPEKK
jgi:hypothetical protein